MGGLPVAPPGPRSRGFPDLPASVYSGYKQEQCHKARWRVRAEGSGSMRLYQYVHWGSACFMCSRVAELVHIEAAAQFPLQWRVFHPSILIAPMIVLGVESSCDETGFALY